MTTLYSATMSLDGYIAGPGGDMGWLTPYLEDDLGPEADTLVEEVGCLLVGGRTHRGDDPNAGTDSEGAFGGSYGGPAVVLSRTLDPNQPGVDLVTDDVRTAVERATELAAGHYVNILGAEAAGSVHDAGLLDEILVFVAPVLLGDGTPLFHRAGGQQVRLERKPGSTAHWYRVLR
ncbi:deaminase [Aeromicrobium sp. PE09-221]|uniref:dihydrofolate reductase family protein n=1 Tax=Aeromicrobium sp. PE09-221 TaxID=1898043 RepID=UPI000B655860|nr:dihydrofolate reductase family protein [Aeromicrobium sp. PE09-221]OUZ07647.1 deaminase [Aeromicrobium sp. PE09-221]